MAIFSNRVSINDSESGTVALLKKKEAAISVAVAEVPQVVSISASMEGKRSSNKYATSS